MAIIASTSSIIGQQATLLRMQATHPTGPAMPSLPSRQIANSDIPNRLAQAVADRQALDNRLAASNEVQGTQHKAEINSYMLSEVTDILLKMKSLLTSAASSPSQAAAIGDELSALKDSLSNNVRSASVDGENWLNDTTSTPHTLSTSVSTAANGNVTVKQTDFSGLGTVLTSDRDAERGVVTRSYTGSTDAGTAYSYHLLNSASGSSSQEIRITAATTAEQLKGMIAAVDGMIEGVATAKKNLSAVAEETSSSSRETIRALIAETPQRAINLDQLHEAALASFTRQTRDEIVANALAIANARPNVLATLR